jgi:hypothetical protein
MTTIRVSAVATVRDALTQSMELAQCDAYKAPYLNALQALSVGAGDDPVTIDLEPHAWALLSALERRAGIARDELDGTGPESRERAAWARMTIAEVALDTLGLSGGVMATQPFAPTRVASVDAAPAT